MYVIGLDIGTTGIKSTVFDERAAVVSHAYEEYDLISEGPGMYELDPNVIREAGFRVIAQSVSGCKKSEIRAIAMSSFAESFVCLDEGGAVLCNTMMYIDTRGEQECRDFIEQGGGARAFAATGHYPAAMATCFKLKWMQTHKPDVMRRIRKIHLIADYMAHCLGAEPLCDYSLAARTNFFDIHQKTWWAEGLEFAGITADMLPQPVHSGACAGNISAAASQKTGLPTTTKIVIGGHDQAMAAVGGGMYKDGDLINGMGTVDCLTAIFSEDRISDEFMAHNLTVVPYLDTGLYYTLAFNKSGGCVVKWFRDILAKDLKGRKDAYDVLNSEAPPWPTDLIVLPYLGTAGTPSMDSTTPGFVSGLRLNTGRGELFRAFLEGEAYEMRVNLDCLESLGIHADEIVTVGGGSNSALWMGIRADVFHRRVRIPVHKEAGTLGNAIVCYRNIGLYDTFEEAQQNIVKMEKTFEPDPGRVKKYDENFQRYLELYRKMKDVYSEST